MFSWGVGLRPISQAVCYCSKINSENWKYFFSNCSQCTVHILPRIYFLPFQTFNLIIITTFVAIIPKLFVWTYMESTPWKTWSLWRNTNVELATCAQCIDHLLVTIADDIPEQSLFVLIQCWRKSRQIYGLQWDRGSDKLSDFDGVCPSQLYGICYVQSSHLMIAQCMSHTQNSHAILSRFPLRGE